MIPKTTTYKQFKEKKAREAGAGKPEMEKGQRTLNGAGGTNGAMPQDSQEPKISSPTVARTPMVPVSALIAERTVEPSARPDADVEMKD